MRESERGMGGYIDVDKREREREREGEGRGGRERRVRGRMNNLVDYLRKKIP